MRCCFAVCASEAFTPYDGRLRPACPTQAKGSKANDAAHRPRTSLGNRLFGLWSVDLLNLATSDLQSLGLSNPTVRNMFAQSNGGDVAPQSLEVLGCRPLGYALLEHGFCNFATHSNYRVCGLFNPFNRFGCRTEFQGGAGGDVQAPARNSCQTSLLLPASYRFLHTLEWGAKNIK